MYLMVILRVYKCMLRRITVNGTQAENNKRVRSVLSLNIVTVIRRRTHFYVVSLWTDVLSGFQRRTFIASTNRFRFCRRRFSDHALSGWRVAELSDTVRMEVADTERSKTEKKRLSFRYRERAVWLSRLSLLNRAWIIVIWIAPRRHPMVRIIL